MPRFKQRAARRRDPGFTLIELVVTMAIIALLAAIAVPSYRQYVIRGHRSAAKAVMMDIAMREQQYLLANRVYADKTTLEASGYALPSEASDYYTWAVAVPDPGLSASPEPSFKITLTPTGGQTSDGALTLNSRGTKTPPEKWTK